MGFQNLCCDDTGALLKIFELTRDHVPLMQKLAEWMVQTQRDDGYILKQDATLNAGMVS